MNIVLSPELEKLVAEKIQSGRYQNAAELIAEALRALEERDQAEERLEALLEEAEKSGEPTEMTQEDWAEIEREGLARLRSRKPARS